MGLETPHAAEQVIRESLTREVPRKSFADLKKRLQLSELILYLGDNCGEIVYDKLLIETIKSNYDTEVVFVVRSVPTLNDVTIREAKLVGMDDTATVMENGIDGPFPGTILSRCYSELR
jgi:damage-control phosphatase, subfamily I